MLLSKQSSVLTGGSSGARPPRPRTLPCRGDHLNYSNVAPRWDSQTGLFAQRHGTAPKTCVCLCLAVQPSDNVPRSPPPSLPPNNPLYLNHLWSPWVTKGSSSSRLPPCVSPLFGRHNGGEMLSSIAVCCCCYDLGTASKSFLQFYNYFCHGRDYGQSNRYGPENYGPIWDA